MTKLFELEPVFVELIDSELEQGKLYISEKYGVAIHLCACGWCNQQTVTPIHNPYTGWSMTNIDGKVTLSPSIGNFQMPCNSHYFVRENKVVWC
jgi:hypothetical protein